MLGFGGPNAHLALMLDEVVDRRRWLTREHFLQLMGIANLIPGPTSSEVAIQIGYARRGWMGAMVTGLAFLGPTFVMVLGFSYLYFRFGDLPGVSPLFWGLKPAVVAIILAAGVKLSRAAVTRGELLVLAVLGLAIGTFAGRAAVFAMIVGGLVAWLGYRARGGQEPPEQRRRGNGVTRLRTWVLLPLVTGLSAGPIGSVFWLHLWIGSVLLGGGYVLVALLEPFAVGDMGWLTHAQFLDGIALTQAVPGPISTLSAFVGYAAAGVPGAFAATAGVYLPAFAAVLLVSPHVERLRHSGPFRAALEGVSAVASGVILGVAITLTAPALPDIGAGVLLLVAIVLLARGVRVPWVVLLGLVAGLVRGLFG